MKKNNKFKVKYFHLCDFASLTNDGKTNIMGIFERILTTKIPTNFPSISIVFNLETTEDINNELLMSIYDPERKNIFSEKINARLDIPKGASKANMVAVFDIKNLPIKTIGEYVIEISTGNESILKEKLIVEKNKNGK